MGFLDLFKGTDRHATDEVTAPAQKTIQESQERLSRINRILEESSGAETRLSNVKRILFEARQAELAVQRRKGH